MNVCFLLSQFLFHPQGAFVSSPRPLPAGHPLAPGPSGRKGRLHVPGGQRQPVFADTAEAGPAQVRRHSDVRGGSNSGSWASEPEGPGAAETSLPHVCGWAQRPVSQGERISLTRVEGRLGREKENLCLNLKIKMLMRFYSRNISD